VLAAAGEARGVPVASPDALAAVEVELRYEGYVRREERRAEVLRRQAKVVLPRDLPYMELETLSWEAREKLDTLRPETLAQAGRVRGVSPADVQALLLEVRRWRRGRPAEVSSPGGE
jgi:tRNA uridine 5-carboxymethylaminomethyl modification enzyme